MANQANISNRKKKWIFLGLGLLTAGLSLFGYSYWKKNKQKSSAGKAPEFKAEKPKAASRPTAKKQSTAKPKQAGPPPKSSGAPKASSKTKTTKTQSKVFPLKMGDKNSYVKNFQTGLIKKYGKTILPKFGADGSFGKELAAAIRKIQKHSTASVVSISETLYKSIVPSKVLTGTEQSLIITTSPTKVWKDPRTAVSVPVNMVLGEQVAQRGSFTLFANEGQYFLVETSTIKPYNATT